MSIESVNLFANSVNSNTSLTKDSTKEEFDEYTKSIYEKYGKETEELDLLDDETGFLKASYNDVFDAFVNELIKQSEDKSYVPKIKYDNERDTIPVNEEMKEVVGRYIFSYDSDGDGEYETSIIFNGNKMLNTHAVENENERVVYSPMYANSPDGTAQGAMVIYTNSDGTKMYYDTSTEQLYSAQF